MPTLQEIIDNKTQYPDTQEIVLTSGSGELVKVTLGDLRGGFMKDADYRKKTTEVANQRRDLDRQRQEWEKERADAEAKLQEIAAKLVKQPSVTTEDDLTEAIKADPVGKYLLEKLESVTKDMGELKESAKRLDDTTKLHAETYLADQHRRVLAHLKQRDKDLNEEELIAFAQQNYVPRLDLAYRLMTEEKRHKAVTDEAVKKAREEGVAEGRKAATQPVIPSRRAPILPPEGAPKTFEEAAEKALQDPEILAALRGEGAG